MEINQSRSDYLGERQWWCLSRYEFPCFQTITAFHSESKTAKIVKSSQTPHDDIRSNTTSISNSACYKATSAKEGEIKKRETRTGSIGKFWRTDLDVSGSDKIREWEMDWCGFCSTSWWAFEVSGGSWTTVIHFVLIFYLIFSYFVCYLFKFILFEIQIWSVFIDNSQYIAWLPSPYNFLSSHIIFQFHIWKIKIIVLNNFYLFQS